MSSAYFTNTVDSNWDTLDNWFSDAAFTSPLGSLPQNGDDIYVYGQVDGYNFTGPEGYTFNNGYFDASGSGYGTFTNLTYHFSGNVSFNNGYFYTDNGTLYATNVTFNQDSGIGSNGSCSIYANYVIFNDYSYNGGTVNGDATFNDESYNNATVGGIATFNGKSYSSTNSTFSSYVIYNDDSHSENNGSVTFTVAPTINGYALEILDLSTWAFTRSKRNINSSSILGIL
jgi:hypothetical protein